MSAALFGKKEPSLRPLKRADVAKVVSIIEEHDEDDAEEAYHSLQNSLEGMFVLDESGAFSLEQSGGVFAVIGARSEPDVPDIVWLSWTYVAENKRRQGWGRKMMEQLIEMLRQNGIRKMFIATSDYVEDGEELYGAARAFYTNFGARLELSVPAFHDDDEAQLIYGLSLEPPESGEDMTADIPPLTGKLEFYDVNPLAESEQGFALNWRMHDEGQGENVPPPLEQLQHYSAEGVEHKARILLATLPSDVSKNMTNDFDQTGFQHIGHLQDYHCKGVHQEYWMKTFA